MDPLPLVLASTSPQRRRLLEQIGVDIEVRPVACDEDLGQHPDADELVGLVTRQKMDAALAQLPPELLAQRWVLTSDTLVSLDHHRLGKPETPEEADAFLTLLSGRTHEVLTGVCLRLPPRGGQAARIVYARSVSRVSFRALDAFDRQRHLDSGEWREAAGGYRIQGRAGAFVERIEGSYTGIVGLPIELVYGMLREHRYW